MSKSEKKNIDCADCGHTQEATLYHSINISVDPELRKELFEGRVNIIKCEQCGKDTFLNIPLLYPEIKLKFCVQYYPPDAMEYEDFFEMFHSEFPARIKTEVPTEMDHLMPDYLLKPQIVFEMRDMVYSIFFYEQLLDENDDE